MSTKTPTTTTTPGTVLDAADRFKKVDWASYRRWRIHNYRASLAQSYRTAGRLAEAEENEAIAKAAQEGTLSFSHGPAVPIESKRRAPLELLEEL